MDADLVELTGYFYLVLPVKDDSCLLLAVSQRRIQDFDTGGESKTQIGRAHV